MSVTEWLGNCLQNNFMQVRILSVSWSLSQTLNDIIMLASVAQLVSAFDCYKCLKKAKSSKG